MIEYAPGRIFRKGRATGKFIDRNPDGIYIIEWHQYADGTLAPESNGYRSRCGYDLTREWFTTAFPIYPASIKLNQELIPEC